MKRGCHDPGHRRVSFSVMACKAISAIMRQYLPANCRNFPLDSRKLCAFGQFWGILRQNFVGMACAYGQAEVEKGRNGCHPYHETGNAMRWSDGCQSINGFGKGQETPIFYQYDYCPQGKRAGTPAVIPRDGDRQSAPPRRYSIHGGMSCTSITIKWLPM